MSEPERITLLVPSRAEHLDLAQRVAEEVAQAAGFDEDERLDIGLAVREGTVNAMKHGHGFEASKLVRLELEANGQRMLIRVSDRGGGFDLSQAPDPTSDENLWRTSGRGLLLIRSLVDSIDFRSDDGESTLILVKNRRPEA